jgi:hypothetical protein
MCIQGKGLLIDPIQPPGVRILRTRAYRIDHDVGLDAQDVRVALESLDARCGKRGGEAPDGGGVYIVELGSRRGRGSPGESTDVGDSLAQSEDVPPGDHFASCSDFLVGPSRDRLDAFGRWE